MKKILFLFLILLLSKPLFAATFVVTSNADSGPGTLRQALLDAAANGTAEKDYINFNLPDLSVAGRTIAIQSVLPAINSDMVIDGSTQPGTPIAINGANVILQINYDQGNTGTVNVIGFYIKGVNDVEIDGMVIRGLHNPLTDVFYVGTGILIDGTNKNIIIGKPGKGNVFYDNGQAIQTTVGEGSFTTKSFTNLLELKSNLIGVKEDGKTIASSVQSNCGFVYINNMIIGGDTKAEGNVFYNITAITPLRDNNDVLTDNLSFKIRNNIFGANAFEQKSTDPAVNTNANANYLSLGVPAQKVYTFSSTVDIRDNTFGTTMSVTGFQNLNMLIQHNFFGTSANGQNKLPITSGALYLRYLRGVSLVGGADVSKGNIFTNCVQDTAIARGDPTVNVEDFGPALDPGFKVELSHNSFYCNNNAPFTYDIYYDKKPLIPLSVDALTTTSVSGKAVPNARIDLYYTDIECKHCQPKTFLATVQANTSGDWLYSGALLPGYGVIASATLNQLTSEFTDTRVYYGPAYIGIFNAKCGTGGSITGFYTANAKKVQWINVDTHQVVGNNVVLTNAPPGKYRLKAEQFGCVAYSDIYEIGDNSPGVGDIGLKVTNPSCGIGGSIKGLYTFNANKIAWLDAAGTIKGTQLDITGLAEGSYTLQLTGEENCIKTYGPVVLKNTLGPNINQSAAITTPTNCGEAKGSITNITATGTGTLKYSWKNAAGIQVATTKDLINQPGGLYTLQVTDDTQCGPVYSTAIPITELNGVTLDDSQKIIAQPSCKYNGGSITNLKLTGATIFKWYNGANPNAVIATTADLANVTAGNYYLVASNASGCSVTSPTYAITLERGPDFGGTTKKLTNATCNLNNGRIEVIFEKLPLPAGAVVSYRWVNHATSQTERITTTPVLTDIDAGAYDIYTTNSAGCETYLITYSIGRSASITVNSTNVKLINDACAAAGGSIKGITVSGSAALTYLWADAAGKPVGNNADLLNVKAGSYTLTVTATDLNCSQTYGPVNIIDGAAVKIDQSAAIITPTNCGVRKGSITNITVSGTGTLKYTWKNPLGGIVGTNKDLTNQSGGVYTLQVTDDSQCGPVYSAAITIPEINGIVIDDSKKVISNANCQLDNGSITGIKVPGATFYKWYSVNNQVVSTDVNLTGVPIGSYYLVAANGNGCSATSSTYVITRDNGTDFGLLTKILKNATCGANNGSIEIGFTNSSAPRPTGYRWVNHVTGATIKRTTSPILTDLDAGVYDVYVTISTMVCEQLLNSCVIERNPGLDVVTTNAKVTDDACEGNTGSITGIGITGTTPLTYYWTDDKGKMVSNALDLKNVKAGAYLLNVKDGSGCQEGVAFNINSSTLALTAPIVKEIQLCSAGDAVISLPALTPGYGYRLYNSLTDNQPADVSTTGKFKIKAAKSRSYYVSLYAGNCESAKAEVKISVGISLQNLVNTFSPNGDGVNDTWKIPGIENYPAAVVQIFNRSGDKVFNSIGYETAFDGNYKGKPLPTGTYYYIVNLNSGCSLLSGSLTIIR